MCTCYVQKRICNICLKITTLKKRLCNLVSPAQVAILPQTPNHWPYTNQEAEKYKERSNLTNKLVSTVIAQQCEDIAF